MCQRKKKQPLATLPYHRAPTFLRFNPFIKKGYRSNLSTAQCFHSVLSWNNETLNIWSHLFGFIVFFGLFVYDMTVVFYKYKGTEYDAIIASFVLFCFMICMLLSSLYHTLNCRSEDSCRKWLSYDIFGISASFLAIFLSGIYYGFWCPEYLTHRYVYMSLVCFLFTGAMAFLLTPRLLGEEWEWARVTLFSVWAASGLLPTIHWTILHGGIDSGIVQIFLPRIFVMYGISGTAVIVYVWKVPERYFPGRFDFVGASHQLWHVIIVAALVHWHQTGLEYARYRQAYGCNTSMIFP
ncbi:progestin and adipoQ receptor family member 3-like [Homarus americanus]|nr:progestin and adipoQ receptor family member 3-like [Homarus americanus]XP_042230193.1 progestin and adipoQ receptor family member 3-like [Homarus americanus]XP_042230275.1 progestin and adipoQ receptor family member 3-like [Homarus americanus]XP_042230360.1 progestin and adipoQ receptor family member 3-like [Homarus americanus]